MASRPAFIHLKDFQIRQHRRAIEQLHIMIADIELLANNLGREIRAEEDRAGMHDPTYFAYPTFAKAAIQRRDNLRQSADSLKTQLDAATKALNQAIEGSEAIALSDGGDQPPNRPQSIGLECLG
jgi:flagellar FliJ protein